MTQSLHVTTNMLMRRLVRREADVALQKVLEKARPEDVAAAMEHLTQGEQDRLFQAIKDQNFAAEVLSRMSETSAGMLVKRVQEDVVAALVDRMELDDARDIVEALAEDAQERVLDSLEDQETAEGVKELLNWPNDSAGGIMSPHVFVQSSTTSCSDAITVIQSEHEKYESIHYIYVVDSVHRLIGVTSLRSLLVHPAHTQLGEIMTRDLITVLPTEDQEEVAKKVARYDLLAIPVIDAGEHLLGIVTVDDVIDVIREEAAEDMMLMVGLKDSFSGRSVFSETRVRAAWLLATIIGGMVAVEIIYGFEGHVRSFAVLAGFIPVIMGMGGNVGIQSGTVAVRGLATGHVLLSGVGRFLFREARIGIGIGVVYGTLLGLYGVVRFPSEPLLSVTIGLSIFLAIAAATIVGSSVPLVLHRLKADPAIATGPFVTTAVDIIGIVIFLGIASLLLAP